MIDGLSGATVACGIKKRGKPDLTLMIVGSPEKSPEKSPGESSEKSPGESSGKSSGAMAAAFTSSRCPSAPVLWSRSIARFGKIRGIVVNAGNANALTGKAGRKAVEETAQAAADALSCSPEEIFIASTGVVGEPLPVDRIVTSIPDLVQNQSRDFWSESARAIMTTDTFPKGEWGRFSVGDQNFTIAGIAKGAGMIAPNMATTLTFLFTDAPCSAAFLDQALQSCLGRSFNAITVDGDMSPSDTIMLASTVGPVEGDGTGKDDGMSKDDGTGPGKNDGMSKGEDDMMAAFSHCLLDVMQKLAQSVARDGEGAEKFLTINVRGTRDDADARRAAMQVANSLLVKTAIAGGDPNWGRIIAVLGSAECSMEVEKIALDIGGLAVMRQGERVADYDESAVAATMQEEDIVIAIDLGMGDGEFTVWSCDLTADYVRINADYRS